ncbi:MAG: hypothetical protein M1828_005989 [Chrysothrix sp. TS-e1954]|nr:MAG: hypothetical protein M1828_005989 [Chrysothrix sp. TS-e1954]
MPYEWSQREVLWHRRREQMREALERDPYETLFGTSNRFINALWERQIAKMPDGPWRDAIIGKMQKEQISHDRNESVSPRKADTTRPRQTPKDDGSKTNRAQSTDSLRPAKSSTSSTKGGPKTVMSQSVYVSGVHSSSSSADDKGANGPSQDPAVQSHMSWKTSGIDSSGKTFEKSGRMVFDPISMKMIPELTEDGKESANKPAPTKIDSALPQAVVKHETSVPEHQKEQHSLKKSHSANPSPSKVPLPSGKVLNEAALAASKAQTTSSGKPADLAQEPTWSQAKTALEKSWNDEKRMLSGSQSQADDKNSRLGPNLTQRLCSAQTRMARKWAKDAEYWKVSSLAKQQAWSSYLKAEASAIASSKGSSDAPKHVFNLSSSLLQDPLHTQALRVLESQNAQHIGALPEYVKAHLPKDRSSTRAEQKLPASVVEAAERSENPSSEGRLRKEYSAHRSIHLKNKPLKFMSAWEFHTHRKTLLRQWNSKQHEPQIPSPTATRLQQEITLQKSIMDAVENKRASENLSKPIKPCAAHTKPPLARKEPELTAGEGDMCANVVNFVNDGRWYKQTNEQRRENEQRRKDRELVQQVRNAYEDTYGPITENHRQSRPSRDQNISEANERGATKPQTFLADFLKEQSAKSPQTLDGRPQSSLTRGVDTTHHSTSPIQSSGRGVEEATNASVKDLPSSPQSETWCNVFEYDPATGHIRSWGEKSTSEATSMVLSTQEALGKLHQPGKFLGRLYKAGRLDEPICFAEGNMLQTRTSYQARLLPKVNTCKPRSGPRYEPAQPDHARTRPSRHVRRQEAVFSGMNPKQRERIDSILYKSHGSSRAAQAKPAAKGPSTHEAETTGRCVNSLNRHGRRRPLDRAVRRGIYATLAGATLAFYVNNYVDFGKEQSGRHVEDKTPSKADDNAAVYVNEPKAKVETSILAPAADERLVTPITLDDEELCMDDESEEWDAASFSWVELPLLGTLGLYAWYLFFY